MNCNPPNIVIFLSDDLGYNDLSCYAPNRHHTPNIDRLAGEGIRFTDFHSNGAMCSPTRAALLTGRFQQRCGVEFVLPGILPGGKPKEEQPRLSWREMNFGRAFSEAGYATAFFGKYHTVYMSDNGGHHEVTDNAPLRGAKGDMFEGGHRVPAFCRWPGNIPGGRVSGETVMTMDVFPTLLSIAGQEMPPGVAFDGIDVSAHLLRGESLRERNLFWRTGPDKAAVREGPWKLVRQSGKDMLFNLDDDLGETDDLAARYPEIVKKLQSALREWEADVQG